MAIAKRCMMIFALCTLCFSLTGCSNESVDQSLMERYSKNGRLEQYYEIRDRYDNIKAIMLLNAESDSMWITNFTLWCVFSFLPDLPEACATGSVVAIIYGLAWWLGVVLTGGGILAVLAYLGTMLGGIPGIPPALAGIVFLGAMFSLLLKIFEALFS